MDTLTLIETFVPFHAIDMKNKDYFGKIGVVSFGEKLKLNLKNCGVCIKNEKDAILPEKDETGDYVCFIITEGDTCPKKLEIVIDKIGAIKFEIFGGNISDGKWTSIETSRRFLIMEEFNEKFYDIIKTLK